MACNLLDPAMSPHAVSQRIMQLAQAHGISVGQPYIIGGRTPDQLVESAEATLEHRQGQEQ